MTVTRIDRTGSEHLPVQFAIRTFESITEPGKNEHSLAENLYIVLVVQHGRGNVIIDMDQFCINANTIYYIRPYQAITITLEEPIKGYLISCEQKYIDLFEERHSGFSRAALLMNSAMLPVIKVPDESVAFIFNIADRMLNEFTNAYELRAEIISALFKIFMICLFRECSHSLNAEFQSRKSELVRLFFSLLENHFTEKKMAKYYADKLLLTPGYLNKIVKEITRYTVSYHIQQRIILEAKRRYIFDGKSLKEIAYNLGFCDPSHFSKFFKTGTGTSFTEFRRTSSIAC